MLLFGAVEIFARVRWRHDIGWHLLRWVGLLPVAAVAVFVSYCHLSGCSPTTARGRSPTMLARSLLTG